MAPQQHEPIAIVGSACSFPGGANSSSALGCHILDSLRGSDTAVYAGTMSVDYADTGISDFDTILKYFATGTNRATISNPLHTEESCVAVACGTQVILNLEAFVVESKLGMLLPTGRSRMWDADADGYARGEGVAAVVLKKLSDAIADGDHIESIIRETGTNQDGRNRDPT
ncbi:thiolase-like protein [Ustulina deusta]|nr:thiolase-like protein [Ustulina deusta]